MRWKFILFAAGLISTSQLNAQENKKLQHRFSFLFSHTHFDGLDNHTNKRKMVIAPSIGLNYELRFNSKWGIGLHNDLTMLKFKQAGEASGEVLERVNPWLVSVIALHKPWKKWTFFAGPGTEFERNKNFPVIKTGIEFGLPLNKSFDIGFGGEYDFKIGGRDSWLLGFIISLNL